MSRAVSHGSKVARIPVGRKSWLGVSGSVFIGVTVFTAIGAINAQNNLLFWFFGLGVGAVIVSGFVSGLGLIGVQAERILPNHATVGTISRVQYRIINTNHRWPVFALTTKEQLKKNGSLLWQRASIPRVAAGSTNLSSGAILPLARGICEISRFDVSSSFPFGLLKKSIVFDQRAKIVIHPPSMRLRPELIDSILVSGDFGAIASNDIGIGEEFYGLREYTPGDQVKHIAWKRSARGNGLLVNQYTAPGPRRVWIWLMVQPTQSDSNTTSKYKRKPAMTWQERTLSDQFECSVSLAASIARLACDDGVSVGLHVPWAGLSVQPRSGARTVDIILNTLTELGQAPQDHYSLARSFSQMRDACIVIHNGANKSTPDKAIHLDIRNIDSIMLGWSEGNTGASP